MAVAGDRDLEDARRYELPEEPDSDDEGARLRHSNDSIRLGTSPGRSRVASPVGEEEEQEGDGYAYGQGPMATFQALKEQADGLAKANGQREGGGRKAPRKREPVKHGKGVAIGGLICLLCLAYFFTYFATSGTRYSHSRKVNVILMISDGFGPASETFAREFVQHMHENTPDSVDGRWGFPEGFRDKNGLLDGGFGHLPLDPLLVGTSRTRSSNSLVTDSAAGATAFACGIKTYNGGIAVEPEGQAPCGTVLEAAKHQGYLTGLVATSRITHATPASFYSHVVDRDLESNIAPFLIGDGPLGHVVDLAFGGGARFFTPNNTEGSSRTDAQDLFATAADKKEYRVLRTGADFDGWWSGGKAKTDVPVLGIFNDDHLNYEIDRIALDHPVAEPSLRNMSLAAMQTLSKAAHSKNAHGFFLMIEGSRIDMAEHSNDPVGTLYDILAYHETVRTVKAWVDEANRAGWDTVMISVSDHETGGLSLGRQLTSAYPEYLWYPSVLANATHSTAHLAEMLGSQSQPASRDYVRDTILAQGLGITDSNDREIDDLISRTNDADYLLADMISRRAQLGWSTHGHSGVDVNLYAYPHDFAEPLMGSHENTDICDFIQETMLIDLGPVTADLNRNSKSWHNIDAGDSKGEHLKLKAYSHEF